MLGLQQNLPTKIMTSDVKYRIGFYLDFIYKIILNCRLIMYCRIK